MKGLLIKDFHSLWSYLKAFFLLDILIIVASRFTNSAFLLFYPCILTGLVCVTLIAYDEKEKWHAYALTLPCSRAQMVSSKYITSLILSATVISLLFLVQLTWPEGLKQAGILLFTTVPASLIPTALLLPFIFKFGAEKGRMVYYMLIGAFCGIAALISGNSIFEANTTENISLSNPVLGIGLIAASVILYAISWLLSIHFYQKRQL